MTRWIWIVAGPPGAGKSTLTARLFPTWIDTSRHIDADDTLAFSEGEDVPPGLHDRVVSLSKRFQVAEVGARDFVIETRMINDEPLITAQKLRRRGWRVAFVYLALPRIDLCWKRVRARTAVGGTDVPSDMMERGFTSALDQIPKYLDIADRWLLLDSSGRRRPRIGHGTLTSAVAFQADALRALTPSYPLKSAQPSHRSAPWADMVTTEFDKLARRHGVLERLRSIADVVEAHQSQAVRR